MRDVLDMGELKLSERRRSWWLIVVEEAEGSFLARGSCRNPAGVQSRPLGQHGRKGRDWLDAGAQLPFGRGSFGSLCGDGRKRMEVVSFQRVPLGGGHCRCLPSKWVGK